MNEQFRKDIIEHQDVFWFSQPLDETELRQAQRQWNPPVTLLEFWKEFGAGLMFESERILRPFSGEIPMDLVTAQERTKGLPTDITVFHIGVVISGFSSRGFEAFDAGSYNFIGQFSSLNDWYADGIRELFAQRYGLA